MNPGRLLYSNLCTNFYLLPIYGGRLAVVVVQDHDIHRECLPGGIALENRIDGTIASEKKCILIFSLRLLAT